MVISAMASNNNFEASSSTRTRSASKPQGSTEKRMGTPRMVVQKYALIAIAKMETVALSIANAKVMESHIWGLGRCN